MLVDTHNDFLIKLKSDSDIKSYMDKVENELDLLCSPVWTTELKDPLQKLIDSKEILKDKFKLSIEDCFFINNSNLEKVLELKPFYCGLTWNYSNAYAGGCSMDGGVTREGKDLIKTFENNGIIVDTAHLNRKSFFDLANTTTKPIFNSHTACDTLCPMQRNLNDEQIKLVGKSNGFIGVYFVGDFLKPDGEVTSLDVAKHIFHILELVGDNCVGLGTDFNGTDSLPTDLKGYNDVVNIYRHLKDMGVTDNTIKKIESENFYRFYNLYKNSN